MVFIRLPSSKSRTTLTAEPVPSTPLSSTHTVPLVHAGASFLQWVAPPSEAELAASLHASRVNSDNDSDDEGYGVIGEIYKTGRTITRDVSQKHGEKTKKAKVEEEVDYYKVLGLGKWGTDSTPKQIHKGYHRAILKYHPDKQQNRPASAGRLEEDPVFLAIQKAYKYLSDQTLRRSYDSTFDFDESIPSGHEKLSDMAFFDVYGPVFARNARFSEIKPVPPLGDINTPMEGAWGVNAFYDFWFKFDSWREFSSLDEHNANEAEDREEKRWMNKKNKSARAARKKKDMQRYRTLVERARASDPRVKAYVKLQKEEREKEKEIKKAAREAYKQGLANDKKAKEDAILAEKAAKEAEKKERQKQVAGTKKLLKKLRRKWNKYCEELDVDDENVPELVEVLGLEDGTKELERLKQNNATAEELTTLLNQAINGAEAMRAEMEAKKQAQFAAVKKANEDASAANEVPWTKEEMEMLIKAMKKYPAGSQRRWPCLGEYVNTLGLTTTRTKEECIDKAKAITKKQHEEIKKKAQEEEAKKIAAKLEAIKRQEEEAAKLAAMPVVWSSGEDRALTRALITFKASMNKTERWECIAEQLALDVQSTKTPKQCQQKFKKLRAEAAELKAKGLKVADTASSGKREKKAIPEEAFGKKPKGKKGKKNHAKAAHKGKKVVAQTPEPEVKEKEEVKEEATPAAPAAPTPAQPVVQWSKGEQHALEKALKANPVSMNKKDRWLAISKAVNAAGEGGKSSRKCMMRFKEIRAQSQRTAGLGNKDDRTPEWKKKQAAEKKKAKGYFTTTQDPDERKKKKLDKSDEKKNKFKEAAKTQGTGKKKKKK